MDTLKFLGRWLFWLSIIAAEVIGLAVARSHAVQVFSSTSFSHGREFLSVLFLQVLIAPLAFLLLYRLLARKVVGFIEDWYGIKIVKPATRWGILCSAVFPLVLCALGFLIITFLSGSPIYG
jgi:hypothetical protein